MLIKIIKNWDEPNIFRQTPANNGKWNNCEFTTKDIEVDYVVVLNYIDDDISVECPKNNIFVIMQEPYIKNTFDWMVEGHKQFSKVFTHHIFNSSSKYIESNPMLPWHVDKSYDELKTISLSDIKKEKGISWITSTKSYFPGHKDRMSFLETMKISELDIELFGRGINEIGDKWDGLAPYKYSFAIENSSSKDYWTEKLADCFLSYTMPIYYGCTNIDEYFPKDSMIKIDISKPQEAIEIINTAINDNTWEKNIEAVKKARALVLNKYNFFNQICEICNSNSEIESKKENITLKKYKRTLLRKIISRFKRIK
jgi:hypothetical protein